MKNLIVLLTVTVLAGLSLLSCDKQDAVLEVAEAEQQVQALEGPHDKVTVLNDKGEVLETYTFAAQTADESSYEEGDLIETRLTVRGTELERRPNSTGGVTVRCVTDSDVVCYQSRN